MKKQDPNNLIDHFRDKLKAHEEPYRLGAWEEFRRYRAYKSRVSLFKKIAVIAASVLFAAVLTMSWGYMEQGLFFTSTEEQPVESSLDPDESIAFRIDRLPEIDAVISGNESGDSETLAGAYAGDEQNQADIIRPDQPDYEEQEKRFQIFTDVIEQRTFQTAGSPMMLSVANQVLSDIRGRSVIAGEKKAWFYNESEPVIVSGDAVLAPENDEKKEEIMQLASYAEGVLAGGETGVYVENEREFSMPKVGLGYAPQVSLHKSATDFGMGAGLQLDWEIANRLHLSSGFYLSQNKLDIDDSPELMSTNRTGFQNIESVARLLSLEIPLSLKYDISNNLFATAGISSATFLDETYEYNFQYQEERERVVTDDEGETHTTMTTVLVTENQRQSEPSFNTFHLPAFYTFSVGYQQYVSENRTLTVEPFLKVPAGRLASRGIRYSTAGVQMIVSL